MLQSLRTRALLVSSAAVLGLTLSTLPASAATGAAAQASAGTTAGVIDSTPPKNPDAVATRLYREIASPYCPGMSLTACPSDGAFRLKRRIRERLDSVSAEVVMAELTAEFGPEISGKTPAQGFGLVAWIAPFLGLLLGAVGIVLWTKRSARRARVAGSVAPSATPALDDADRERLSAALRDD